MESSNAVPSGRQGIAQRRDAGLPEWEPILDALCEWYNVSRAQLFAYDRHPEYVSMRRVALGVLNHLGYSYSACARIVGRDPSTVNYQLRQLRARPEEVESVAQIMRCDTGKAADVAFGSLLVHEQVYIRRYLTALSGNGDYGRTAWTGLSLIAAFPAIRPAVRRYLRLVHKEPHYYRIEGHARQLGYRWVREIGSEG